ncbi:MAG: sodium:solute symporter [Cyclobacteriaceae bacterium]|nr:sodium:solute symporter [Cyclobacteriaceae bacterium]
MNPLLILLIITLYFTLLISISWLTSKKSDNLTFFTANRKSPWYLVAFGMVGASLSGVTFISVPGEVGNTAWTYLQFVVGNLAGYTVIAFVLIPLFYRMQLISIYEYLKERLGWYSYKTGAFYFIISQTIGASFRLFLAANVLQLAFFDAYNVPFFVTVIVTLALIWLYTHRGGIKTIVWTDTLQTSFMLLAVTITLFVIYQQSDRSMAEWVASISENRLSQVVEWDWRSDRNFFKLFLAGMFITIVMNGLDQNVMQKNLTCRNEKEAKKNIFWFSITFFIANLFFLALGVALYVYADDAGISLPHRSDDLYPMLALEYFGMAAGITFLLGIIAAAYSSADSALTALTTSFCVDILNIKNMAPERQTLSRKWVHIVFTIIIFLVIVVFREINNQSVVSSVFKAAGFTYGPLLGLFAFGLLTRRKANDKWVLFICLLAPLTSFLIDFNSEIWFWGYKFGFEILLLNGLLTFAALVFSSYFNNNLNQTKINT